MTKAVDFRRVGDDALPVTPVPVTTGGLSVHKAISAASTNEALIQAGPVQIYGWSLYSVNASARYLKLYNTATTPVVGTDTPVMTILIPGSSTGAGNNWQGAHGISFPLGLGFALTTGIADNNTGAVAANEIAVNLHWKG